MELFLIAVIAFEVLSGGFVTSAFAGAAVEGAKAAWGETSKGAKRWYGKRAKRMKKTRMGRWRLRTEATVAGGMAFVGRGLAAGAKAAPGGANKGRKARHAIRRKAVAKARAGGRQVLATGGAKVAEWRTRGGRSGEPVADAGDPTGGQSGEPGGAPSADQKSGHPPMVCINCQGPLEGAMCASEDCAASPKFIPWSDASDEALVRRAARGDKEAARELMRRTGAKGAAKSGARDDSGESNDQTTPPTGGGNTTNQGAGMAENRGVRPYLAIWEQAPEGLETTAASVQQRVDTLASAAEANSVHEVGGIDAVVAAGERAFEALRAFEAQVRVHQAALNEKWPPDVLAGLDATGAESGQELAGAH